MSIEKEVYEYLYKKLSQNDTVIDVGAYIGKTALKICNQINGDPRKFYLIEACPKNFALLKKNCPNFNKFNIAISDADGSLTFHVGNHSDLQGSSQSNSIYKEFIKSKAWNKSPEEFVVKSMTMDSFVKVHNIGKIGLLKVNCEGGEYKIFKNTPNILNKVDYLYLQLHKKSPVFLTEEMDIKRKEIIADISKNFDIIIDDMKQAKGHLHILFKSRG